MSDFVALLGVKGGPAIRPGSNMPTSTLLSMNDKTILIDAGLGATKAICDQGIPLPRIDAIFVTHLHSDHYLELGPLIHTAWTSGLNRTLPVYGPPRLRHYWDAFLVSMEDDIHVRIADEGRVDLSRLIRIHELADGQDLDVEGIAVSTMLNVHPPIEHSFALRFCSRDRSIVLSGDTAYMPEMSDFARDADLLVHEAMLTNGIDALMSHQTNGDERLRAHILRSHTAAEDVGRVATAARVKRLALNHFVPDGYPGVTESDWTDAVRQTWRGPLVIARDGERITL